MQNVINTNQMGMNGEIEAPQASKPKPRGVHYYSTGIPIDIIYPNKCIKFTQNATRDKAPMTSRASVSASSRNLHQ